LAANTSAIVQQLISPSLYFSLRSVQVIGVIFGVLLGGIVADLLGRRFSLVFSLTFFGFCTALVGLFASDLVFLVVYGASGLSWGILFVLYIFVVWGDLSNQDNRIRVYSIGLITYFLSLGVGFSVEVSVPIFQSALLSVLLIFLLNLPLIFAPELLPSYILDKIRMKRHMGTVKKLEEKNQG
jgi:MFS family permease